MKEQKPRPPRVNIYLPPDLRDWWHRLPRFERSALVARLLRAAKQQEEKP